MAYWMEAIMAFLLIYSISAAQPSIVRRQSSLSASQMEEVSSPLKESSESSEASSIVMSDSREVLTKHPSAIKDPSELSFIDMAVVMNYRYAKQHGYNFAFYQMEGCSHSSLGHRHPSWCKLVSLVHTQHLHPNNKYRVYLDSDMFVDGQQHNISIDELLNAALPEMPSKSQGTCGHGYLCEANCSKLVHEGDAWLQTAGGNTNPGLLGAFVILRGGERGDSVLKRVWNIGKDYNLRFPWEQVAWKRTYDQSLHSDRRIVGIGGLDAPWTGYGRPQRCNQFGNLRLAGFTRHSCHFDDDVLLMTNAGSRDARERLRKLYQCGKGGETQAHIHPTEGSEEDKTLEHHNMYAGNRYLEYLRKFQALNLTEKEFRQLYTEAYNSKVKLSQDDMNRLTREMEVAPRSKEMEEADAGSSVSLIEDTSERHLYQQETLEEEYYNEKKTEASIQLNLGQLPKGKWRKMESLCEEFVEGAYEEAPSALSEGMADTYAQRLFEKIFEVSSENPCDAFPDPIHMPLDNGEFGTENVVTIPVAYFLKSCGKLASTHGCGNMSSYYWFSPNHTNDLQCHRGAKEKLTLPGKSPMWIAGIFKTGKVPTAWQPAPYLHHYWSMPILKSKKDFMSAPFQLVIVNKYNAEWGMEPVNFLDYSLLSSFVEEFQSTCGQDARILYAREGSQESSHGEAKNMEDVMFKNNDAMQLLDDDGKTTDWDLMRRQKHVETIHDFYAAYPELSSNELKLRTMTRTKCFISVQGGSGVPVFFFGGTNIVWKRGGRELRPFFEELGPRYSGQQITMVQSHEIYKKRDMLKQFREQMLTNACAPCTRREKI